MLHPCLLVGRKKEKKKQKEEEKEEKKGQVGNTIDQAVAAADIPK